MSHNYDSAVQIQRQYYSDTAAEYDAMRALEGNDSPRTLRWVYGLLRMIEAQTVLDVGAGTGRYIRHLLHDAPGLPVRGIEPVAARIEEAVKKKGIPGAITGQGTGGALPFGDASFDVACRFALLHHALKPNGVARETRRVACKAVIIVDGNRFGQGSWPVRLLKLGLYKVGLWSLVDFLRTRGKRYILSPGDGVQYSYSVYDSFDLIAERADQLTAIPTENYKATNWFHPLLAVGFVFVFPLKDSR